MNERNIEDGPNYTKSQFTTFLFKITCTISGSIISQVDHDDAREITAA